jgi:hypothetical protein
MNSPGPHRNWEPYARALDMRINEGAKLDDIAAVFGVTRARAQQMVALGQRQLAFRVFKGVPRPLPTPAHLDGTGAKFPLYSSGLKN